MTTTVGIIGAGDIGNTVARLALAADIDVVLSTFRGPDTLAGRVAKLGEHAHAATPAEAAHPSTSTPACLCGPQGPSGDPYAWFRITSGTPVPAERVRELVNAVGRRKMAG